LTDPARRAQNGRVIGGSDAERFSL